MRVQEPARCTYVKVASTHTDSEGMHGVKAHLCFGSMQGILKLSRICPETANARLLPGNLAFSCGAAFFFMAQAPCQSLLGKSEGAQLVPVVLFLALPPASC